MSSKSNLIIKAQSAKKESRHLDFKECFDIDSLRDWCEIIKDIVAMANTGGGIIIFGVKNNGKIIKINSSLILNYDLADITNKISKYTGSHFANIETVQIKRGKNLRPAFLISDCYPPMIFTKPGTYPISESKQNTAFSQGTLYFRHGAKSEPATSADLESILEKEIKKRKNSWLGNIKKIIKAPADSEINIDTHDTVYSDTGKITPVLATSNGHAKKIKIDEISLFTKIYKFDTNEVIKKGRKMFADFKPNPKFYNIIRPLKNDPNIYRLRYLNIASQTGGTKGYYSERVFDELKKHYDRKNNS